MRSGRARGGLYKRFNGSDLQLARAARDPLEANGRIKVTKQGRTEYIEEAS